MNNKDVTPLTRINGSTTIYGKRPLVFFKERIEELKRDRITNKSYTYEITKTIGVNRSIIVGGLDDMSKMRIVTRWVNANGTTPALSGELLVDLVNRVERGLGLGGDTEIVDSILINSIKIEEWV